MSLNPRNTPEASVAAIENGWRLEIPTGPAGQYRLAQLDNYRREFPLSTPTTLSLRCRVSEQSLPGTWGFGFWNDPFTVSLGLQGTARRLPVLPKAIWFFHASGANHLSLQNHLPSNGFLAQSFASPNIPSLLLTPGLLALPFMFWKPFALWIRAITAKIVRQDAICLELDVTQWHEYRLSWGAGRAVYTIDGATVFETEISPTGRLGLVIWVDNQFAAFTPTGKISAGTEPNPSPAWMEITDLKIKSPEQRGL
jgi:hypothetical protein